MDGVDPSNGDTRQVFCTVQPGHIRGTGGTGDIESEEVCQIRFLDEKLGKYNEK